MQISSAASPVKPVVIVGAGPTGMATAIELAQNGVASTVLEARGEVGTRTTLFNVTPPFADRLAALDPDGALTDALVATKQFDVEDRVTGRTSGRYPEGGMEPNPDNGRGDMDALLRGIKSPSEPDADNRQWSKVGIGDLDNALRNLAKTKYSDLIDIQYNAKVDSIENGEDFVTANFSTKGNESVKQSMRGAFLIDASGRNLLGSDQTVYPEVANWIGAVLPAPTDGDTTVKRVFDKSESGARISTLALPHDDRTLVWTQLDPGSGPVDAAEGRALLAKRAPSVGVTDSIPEDQNPMPVTVQLKTTDNPASGRVLAVGDSTRAPYFMTSTGAASGLVHDAPRAVDAILAMRDGQPIEQVSTAYADAVRGANEALLEWVRPRFLSDLNIDPADAGAPTKLSANPPASREATPAA